MAKKKIKERKIDRVNRSVSIIVVVLAAFYWGVDASLFSQDGEGSPRREKQAISSTEAVQSPENRSLTQSRRESRPSEKRLVTARLASRSLSQANRELRTLDHGSVLSEARNFPSARREDTASDRTRITEQEWWDRAEEYQEQGIDISENGGDGDYVVDEYAEPIQEVAQDSAPPEETMDEEEYLEFTGRI